MKLSIVGYGHVGHSMHKLFPDAKIYDKWLRIGDRNDASDADLAFVCVPTPMLESGACDTSIVEEVLDWLQAKVIVIRSTVPVGFTDEQAARTGKRLVFQPEYYGETVDHPFANLRERTWITLGGAPENTHVAVCAYQQVYNAELKIMLTDAKTAELAKYMENCYLALKVTFCNEFYDIAQACQINYDELREIWLADPRIGRSHTFVYDHQRGFGGKCLPKDVNALIEIAREKGVNADLMEAVMNKNETLRNR